MKKQTQTPAGVVTGGILLGYFRVFLQHLYRKFGLAEYFESLFLTRSSHINSKKVQDLT